MPKVVLKLFARQRTRQTYIPTLHIVSYSAGTNVFRSLHKPIITFFITPKNPFYEFTNSFHAKYKPISSKCWLVRTDKAATIFFPPFGSINNYGSNILTSIMKYKHRSHRWKGTAGSECLILFIF